MFEIDEYQPSAGIGWSVLVQEYPSMPQRLLTKSPGWCAGARLARLRPASEFTDSPSNRRESQVAASRYGPEKTCAGSGTRLWPDGTIACVTAAACLLVGTGCTQGRTFAEQRVWVPERSTFTRRR